MKIKKKKKKRNKPNINKTSPQIYILMFYFFLNKRQLVKYEKIIYIKYLLLLFRLDKKKR